MVGFDGHETFRLQRRGRSGRGHGGEFAPHRLLEYRGRGITNTDFGAEGREQLLKLPRETTVQVLRFEVGLSRSGDCEFADGVTLLRRRVASSDGLVAFGSGRNIVLEVGNHAGRREALVELTRNVTCKPWHQYINIINIMLNDNIRFKLKCGFN